MEAGTVCNNILCWCMLTVKLCCAGNIHQAWEQCAAEALILSQMIKTDCHIERFVPVFGGDLVQHMVIHNYSSDEWHAASSGPSDEEQKTAVACMRFLFRRSQSNMDGQGVCYTATLLQVYFACSCSNQSMSDMLFQLSDAHDNCAIICLYLCADGSSSSGDVGLPIEDDGTVPMDSTATSSSTLESTGGASQDEGMPVLHPSSHVSSQSLGNSMNVKRKTPQQIASFFSEEREEEYAAIWKFLLGSEEHAKAAGLPGVPEHLSHSSFREWFQSICIVYPSSV